MLAYGAVDQIVKDAVEHACQQWPKTVIIYDPAGFASIQQFKAFREQVEFLTKEYRILSDLVSENKTDKKPPVEPAEPRGVDTGGVDSGGGGGAASPNPFLTLAPQIATAVQAGTQENPSSITLSNTAIAMKAANDLLEGCGTEKHAVRVIYPPLYMPAEVKPRGIIAGGIKELYDNRKKVTEKIAKWGLQENFSDLQKFVANRYAGLEQLLSSMVTAYLNPDPNTGLPGIASLVQGFELLEYLEKDDTFVLYLNAVAGGGTQRIRKNLLTYLLTGDWITYSGGAVIACALVQEGAEGPTLKWANTFRYRTPTTRIESPSRGVKDTRKGDNLDPKPGTGSRR